MTKEDVLNHFKDEVAKDPQGAKIKIIESGNKSYSLEDILSEIEQGTPFGNSFVADYIKLHEKNK